MSPIREAIFLPVLFLTIALLGGFRLAEDVRLVPPSLTALILAVLLLGVLIRAGGISASALLHGERTPAENMSGAIVLATLFAATSQALNLLIPDTGLLHAVFAIFIFCQLLTIGAARTDRTGSLRSVVVLFGSLFVLRFILLEGLYSSSGSTLNRVLQALLSGATLGGITYEPNAPATGYVGFFTLALYVVGLLLLPKDSALALVPRRPDLPGALTRSTLVIVLATLTASAACRKADPASGQNHATPEAPPLGHVRTARGRAAIRARLARAGDPDRESEPGKESVGSRRPERRRRRRVQAGDQADGRDDAEVRLRAAGKRRHPREVRSRQSRASRRDRRHTAALRAGIRRRSDVRRQERPLRGLSDVPIPGAQMFR